MLGEIALWMFVIELLTGTYLALFSEPSLGQVVYHGSYLKFNGVTMSEAYQSTLRISFDVRGSLLVRQIHHWSADVFVIAMSAHLLRHFFLGSYRKPRERHPADRHRDLRRRASRWRCSRRSIRSGCRGRTRRWRSRPPRSRTGTWASWRARCGSCPRGRSTSIARFSRPVRSTPPRRWRRSRRAPGARTVQDEDVPFVT